MSLFIFVRDEWEKKIIQNENVIGENNNNVRERM